MFQQKERIAELECALAKMEEIPTSLDGLKGDDSDWTIRSECDMCVNLLIRICILPHSLHYSSELQTAVNNIRDRGAGTLVVCYTSRGSGKSRRIGFPLCLHPVGLLPRSTRQPGCLRRVPAPCL
ncbi:hypothetical protein Y032_0360g3444 [Ancylostoma ceylanicum]|uniref:Uncharacterized protein n=1 Tax=Ancylostoma ceylanicum TaxID=53326 RepID=A0A016RWE4_9BILA|nr:hypothetical protein Y032_0360g3444 [Ancylostoma ceylanicum]